MVATRGAAREAMAEEVVGRMTEIMASQPDVPEGCTPDPELTEVVKRLSGYLQLVVTLMAMMVPPTEESRLREKKGREELDQGVNMVILVSALFSLYFCQVAVDHHPDNILYFSECGGHGLGAPRL